MLCRRSGRRITTRHCVVWAKKICFSSALGHSWRSGFVGRGDLLSQLPQRVLDVVPLALFRWRQLSRDPTFLLVRRASGFETPHNPEGLCGVLLDDKGPPSESEAGPLLFPRIFHTDKSNT